MPAPRLLFPEEFSMKCNVLATAACMLLAGTFTLVSVAQTTAPAAGGPRGRGRGPQAPASLEQAMESIDRSYRAIKADAADPTKQEQTVRNIDTMVRDVAISKLFVPGTVNRQPAEKRAEALNSYRAMMTGLIKTLLDLEEAVNDKKPDEIKKCIAQIEELQKQGHAEFAPEVK
jgi:hypothetical protein